MVLQHAKTNGKVRTCVDLTKLNKCVCRERHPLPAVDQTLEQLAGGKVFSTLDANLGFWQILLTPESSWLTTLITPFGRFCFHRLPFGITSAPLTLTHAPAMELTQTDELVKQETSAYIKAILKAVPSFR